MRKYIEKVVDRVCLWTGVVRHQDEYVRGLVAEINTQRRFASETAQNYKRDAERMGKELQELRAFRRRSLARMTPEHVEEEIVLERERIYAAPRVSKYTEEDASEFATFWKGVR